MPSTPQNRQPKSLTPEIVMQRVFGVGRTMAESMVRRMDSDARAAVIDRYSAGDVGGVLQCATPLVSTETTSPLADFDRAVWTAEDVAESPPDDDDDGDAPAS